MRVKCPECSTEFEGSSDSSTCPNCNKTFGDVATEETAIGVTVPDEIVTRETVNQPFTPADEDALGETRVVKDKEEPELHLRENLSLHYLVLFQVLCLHELLLDLQDVLSARFPLLHSGHFTLIVS